MLDHSNRCGCDDGASDGGLLSVERAVTLAKSLVSAVDKARTIPLADALGRVMAQDIFAPDAMPFFDNSAMDGFAVHCADFVGPGPWTLRAGATIPAGGTARLPLSEGYVDRIFTGAPIPAGCDAVVMIEKTRETKAGIRFDLAPAAGDNIRRAGSDLARGARLIRAGTRIAPHHIGLLAASGLQQLSAVRTVRVGVLSTGDEVKDTARSGGQIFDANRPMLCALARQAGADVTDLGILPDDLTASTQRLAQIADEFDLVLTSGAVSMGGRDFLRPALEAAGGTIEGWRVALKPGKPVMFGRLGRSAITGLPGNPLAALVGFHLFAAAQLRHLSRQAERPFATIPALSGFSWQRKAGRDEVFPVRLTHHSEAGLPLLERLGHGVSATLFPVAHADGFAYVCGQTTSVQPGDALRWQPFSSEF